MAAEAIGVISGVIGIFQFAASLIPQPEEINQKFNIQVALDGTSNGNGDGELSNAGGTIDDIKVYDNNGIQISEKQRTNKVSIGQGTWEEISVDLTGKYQGNTAEFFAGNDAICIATITTTLNNGESFGFTGDWSSICDNIPGYPSGVNLEVTDGSSAQPRCVWIDGDSDSKAKVIGLHFPSVAGYEDSSDVSNRCGQGGGFRAWSSKSKEEGTQMAKSRAGSKKRSVKAGDAHFGRRDNRLVISDSRDSSHQASNVCDEPSNYGPDFVSLNEMTYCNMSSREVLPLCGSDADDGDECFDLDEARGQGLAKRSASALGDRQFKAPTNIIDWTRK